MKTLPPLAVASLATAAALFLLIYTETYTPAGSPWAPIALLLLVIGHLPLLNSADQRGRTPEWLRLLPRWGTAALAILVIVAGAGWFSWRGQDTIFETGVSPYENVQLGLMTQAVARIEQGEHLYAREYPRGERKEAGSTAPGLLIPYALARSWGFDWRYAGVAGVILLAGLLSAGALFIAHRAPPGQEGEAGFCLAALALAGASWLLLPTTLPYLNWGVAIPLWPVAALLGLSLAMGWRAMAALAVGALAAMNPGWLLLLPLVGVVLWKEDRARFPVMAALAVVPPLLAYGAWRAFDVEMWQGILGGAFQEGNSIDPTAAWRFASVQALNSVLSMRYGVYTAALIGLVLIGREILRRDEPVERIRLLLFAAFVVAACGPVAYQHHWMAHGVLAASLIPAAFPRSDWTHQQPRWPVYAGGGVAVLLFLLAGWRILSGFDGALNHQPDHKQSHMAFLETGFHVPSEDHVWGAERRMALGFTLDRVEAGILELSLGTLGGEFTPFNPLVIRVNGREQGIYREYPGNYSTARIPLDPKDLHIGFNTVTLEADWVRTPKSYNVRDDLRPVTIVYQGLRFLPQSAAPTRQAALAEQGADRLLAVDFVDFELNADGRIDAADVVAARPSP